MHSILTPSIPYAFPFLFRLMIPRILYLTGFSINPPISSFMSFSILLNSGFAINFFDVFLQNVNIFSILKYYSLIIHYTCQFALVRSIVFFNCIVVPFVFLFLCCFSISVMLSFIPFVLHCLFRV